MSDTWKQIGAIVKDIALMLGMLFAYLEARDARKEAAGARVTGAANGVKADNNSKAIQKLDDDVDSARIEISDGRYEVEGVSKQVGSIAKGKK